MSNTKGKETKGRLAKLLGGDMLKSQAVVRQIPLLLLILFYCLMIVNVRYRVESLTKEKDRLEKQIGYMREQRVQMQKQYQESIRISRIDMMLDTIDVGLIAGPPYELRVEN